jgi:hypothetical protein
VFAVAAAAYAYGSGPGRATAQDGETRFVLDMSVADGRPCETIEELTVLQDVGDTVEIAVCVLNPAEPVAAVSFTLLYDDRVAFAPNIGRCDGNLEEGEVASIEESLDCNPDANAGATTFGEVSLGEGWDCSAEGLAEPWGNREGLTGDAFNGACLSVAGPYPEDPPARVMAQVTFQAAGRGRTAITPVLVELVGGTTIANLGSCLPTAAAPLDCVGGVLSVRGGEDDDGAAGGDEDGDRRWLALVAVGAVVVVAAAGVGFAAWRGRRGGAGVT